MVDSNDIQRAHQRIKPFIHQTPVLCSELLNALSGADIFFKCENFQKAGAFKYRGAINAVKLLPESDAHAGVATHSSGNHGAALARAASIRGIPAYIVVPTNANAVKKDAILTYGATIIECEPTLKSRETTLQWVVEKTGANFVPPYDDDRIIAGQGTVAVEMLQQISELESVLVPVGGGGLLAGCSIGFASAGIKGIYGVEPSGADDAHRSLKSGVRVQEHTPESICDGLLTTLGERNFPIIRNHVQEILLVSDEEVVAAMRLLWTHLKIIVEPSSAVTMAGLLKHPHLFAGKRVGLILTGGNVDLESIAVLGRLSEDCDRSEGETD